jgi:hypothetical protein
VTFLYWYCLSPFPLRTDVSALKNAPSCGRLSTLDGSIRDRLLDWLMNVYIRFFQM